MIVLRLSRIGKRNQAQFRLIVQEKRRAPSSKALEIVGHYNPHTDPSTITFKEERVKYWISKGAQPSATVHNMLVNAGILKGPKMRVVAKTKATEKPEAEQKKGEKK